MTYVGGLRARLIHDSLFELIRSNLAALHWLDSGRQHRPVNLIARQVPFDEEIPLNTIAVSASNTTSVEAEMGSNLEEETTVYYVDLYAEDESLGNHLSGDIRDILRGKFPSIGRTRPDVQVLDYTTAPAVPLFVCDIENVIRDRAVAYSRPWQRYWYVVRFDLIDTYGDEDDGTTPTPPTTSLLVGPTTLAGPTTLPSP